METTGRLYDQDFQLNFYCESQKKPGCSRASHDPHGRSFLAKATTSTTLPLVQMYETLQCQPLPNSYGAVAQAYSGENGEHSVFSR